MHRRRSPAPHRGPLALTTALLGLLTLLAGCAYFPELEVDRARLRLNNANLPGVFTVRNTGPIGSSLPFEIRSSDPRLIARVDTGVLTVGADGLPSETTVVVDVDLRDFTFGERLDGQLTVASPAGSAAVEVTFEMVVGGLRECGTLVGLDRAGAVRAERAARSGDPFVGAPDQDRSTFVPGELLVGYQRDPLPDGDLRSARLDALAAAYERTAVAARRDLELTVLRPGNAFVPDVIEVDDVEAAAARLRTDPRIAYAHPNARIELLRSVDDPLYPQQWHLAEFGVPAAWDLATGDERDVVIAVIDSGVDLDHPDLRSKLLPGCDFRDDDNDANPGFDDHGTHVTGIAVAQGDNAEGVAGVAFGDRILAQPIKIFDDSGTRADIADLIRALAWATGRPVPGTRDNPTPADIINMSLGAGPGTCDGFEGLAQALDDAAATGVLMVAASGNNATSSSPGVQCPGNHPEVLAIGSVDLTGSAGAYDVVRSSFSDWVPAANGDGVDLMAPGGTGPNACGQVLSTVIGGYGCERGTSMSSPFVAGAAALLLSLEPGLDAAALEARLRATAHLEPDWDTARYGDGVVCPNRLLSDDRANTEVRCGLE